MKIVKFISNKLNISIKESNKASIVVSGGNSLLNIFKELSYTDLPWSKVQVTLVDDRLVDSKNAISNQKLINDRLLINKAKEANFFPLHKDFIVGNLFKIPFDIVLLGMGEDGHFASLFPQMINDYNAFNLNAENNVLITPSLGEPFVPRITMNLSLILSAKIIILVAKGKLKQNILSKAQVDRNFPIHHLLKNRKKNIYIEKIN